MHPALILTPIRLPCAAQPVFLAIIDNRMSLQSSRNRTEPSYAASAEQGGGSERPLPTFHVPRYR